MGKCNQWNHSIIKGMKHINKMIVLKHCGLDGLNHLELENHGNLYPVKVRILVVGPGKDRNTSSNRQQT